MALDNTRAKLPMYLPIYNFLYSAIADGTYIKGKSLPSEISLSKKFGVSRNTVRQALLILQEDGLIEKHQGKGSFVSEHKRIKSVSQKGVDNIVVSNTLVEIDEIKIEYNFSEPTAIAMDKLNLSQADMVVASNIVYFHSNNPISHAFVQMPMNVLSEHNVDLTRKDKILEFIHEIIFKESLRASVQIKLVEAHENITLFLKIDVGTPVLFIEEILYNQEDVPVARYKNYMLSKYFDIKLDIR